MGIKMFLRGEKYLNNLMNDEAKNKVDGFTRESEVLDLGYWRNHANLHGYIAQEFVNCMNEFDKINLSEDNIIQIINAIKKGLPFTKGIRIGESDGTDIIIFEQALKWLISEQDGFSKSIYYLAQ